MGKIYAIADIHLSYKYNLDAFQKYFSSLPSHSHSESVMDLASLAGPESQEYTQDFTSDGLILAGDISEKLDHMRLCFELCAKKFKKVWWVPGNHELYTLPKIEKVDKDNNVIPDTKPNGVNGQTNGRKDTHNSSDEMEDYAELDRKLRGEHKYLACCRVAREYGVLTPEDDYIPWEYECEDNNLDSFAARYSAALPRVNGVRSATKKVKTAKVLVCPIFTLYDYSFRPANISREKCLDWAMEQNCRATDELLLHPDPYETRDEWCNALCDKFEKKLQAAKDKYKLPTIIINHWPLREDTITIPTIPRFTLWCGTRRTADWHVKYNAKVIVTGHLHVRRTDWRDGTRFEEVSLGYPRQWEGVRSIGRGMGNVMREIVPADWNARDGVAGLKGKPPVGTIWRRNG